MMEIAAKGHCRHRTEAEGKREKKRQRGEERDDDYDDDDDDDDDDDSDDDMGVCGGVRLISCTAVVV